MESNNEDDPNDRRRLDAEAQRNRDAKVARLRAADTPFRVIAARLNMSLGGVVRALARSQKPAASHDAVVSEQVYAEDLTPEQLEDPDVWRQLDPLERLRFAYIPGGHPVPLHDDDHQDCCIAHGLDPDARPGPDARRTAGHPWPPGRTR